MGGKRQQQQQQPERGREGRVAEASSVVSSQPHQSQTKARARVYSSRPSSSISLTPLPPSARASSERDPAAQLVSALALSLPLDSRRNLFRSSNYTPAFPSSSFLVIFLSVTLALDGIASSALDIAA
ncbi:hypothetical protein BDZ90DRAFT_176338 [Jaminaea rosea]|uniref:Uncharacterized protein n=1 Tax=Jaminaea rosea TaxID=1569628 RepID=A0A316UW59_9BASI|nr:hypothetical protein BDZ90DRAFT_176338 [Jaminaea rosea]PWN27355.1 hypothetical protein BDZ90DRAFT_176338 [Jaminaea rosea]